MTCRIQLYLNDYLYTEEGFNIPDYDHGVSKEDNFNIKEKIIKSFTKSIVVRHANVIERCSGNYAVYSIFESKMNYFLEFEEP